MDDKIRTLMNSLQQQCQESEITYRHRPHFHEFKAQTQGIENYIAIDDNYLSEKPVEEIWRKLDNFGIIERAFSDQLHHCVKINRNGNLQGYAP